MALSAPTQAGTKLLLLLLLLSLPADNVYHETFNVGDSKALREKKKTENKMSALHKIYSLLSLYLLSG